MMIYGEVDFLFFFFLSLRAPSNHGYDVGLIFWGASKTLSTSYFSHFITPVFGLITRFCLIRVDKSAATSHEFTPVISSISESDYSLISALHRVAFDMVNSCMRVNSKKKSCHVKSSTKSRDRVTSSCGGDDQDEPQIAAAFPGPFQRVPTPAFPRPLQILQLTMSLKLLSCHLPTAGRRFP
ncbi:uncharacterized protein MYCFIDRAFT_207412 [Pseudocercospora fijiensis CIRAD86]|uniref:Uncharacterized protein n=1 Tax=Pseudocercospora fijiensis (strain CIRAD86) TaxID=383855 RepID=M3A126_PSEFD|nr:uncharacterized protein MYCFIDRAFT_207412 [Pseudocercospora fijiensis CIRAD86]EME84854.1 hypothetical protein MYCFIDRAFT_207412 [Pseudocercospora fijiensis CIRAD86]